MTEYELKKHLDTMEIALNLMSCEIIDSGKSEVLKRIKLRVRAELPLVFTYETTAKSAITRDISVGGAYILTDNAPPLGSKISLTIRVTQPDRVDVGRIGARVVRVNEVETSFEEAGFAVQFEFMSQDHMRILFRFVNTVLTGPRKEKT